MLKALVATASRGPASRFAALLLALLAAGPLLAQGAGGDIVGRVKDATGAAQAGVNVTATNLASGLARSATTDSAGQYRLASLRPGRYRLEASLQGFQPTTVDELQVTVGATVTQNISLGAAAASESLTVIAETPLIEPTNPTAHAVVTEELVASLPLNSRNFAELSLLTPGVDLDDTEEEAQDAKGQIQFAAQPSRFTLFVVDGADTTTEGFGGNQIFFSQDAIQEFRVVSANWSAEFGRTMAGVVQVVTKSGGNDVHGTAFGYFRDQALNSKGRFEDEKPEFSRQQFGGTLGGPLRRDRTHYFVSYERQQQSEFGTVNTFGAFPREEGTFETPVDNDLALARVDHQISSRQRLMVKYALDHRKDRNVGVGGGRALSNGGNDDEWRQLGVVNWSVFLRPSLINDLTVSLVNRHSKSFRSSNGPELFYPSVTLGGNNDYGVDFRERKWHVREGLTWSAQRHAVKLGYEYVYGRDTGPYPLFLPGAFFFASDDAPIPDFGLVADGVFVEGNAVQNHGFYVQDDWHVTPRVSLNLGVRYDFQTNALNENERLPRSQALGRPRPKSDRDNFAPRASVAWDVKGDGHSVVRAGAGIYYDQILPNIPFLEILANSRTGIFFVIAPSDLSDPIRTSVFAENTGPTVTLDVLDPAFETPYAIIQNVGLSQRLSPRLALDVDYVRSLGRHEFYNRPINFNPGGTPPFPGFGRIRQFESSARSEYNALQLKLTGNWGARHGGIVSYTLAGAKNLADDFRRQPPSNPFDVEAEWARSGTVARHRFVASGYASLPWTLSVSGIFSARSGQPYNVILGRDANGDGFAVDRPAGLPRNSGDGPSFVSLDLRLVKSIRFAGDKSLQLLVEGFNVTNRTNFDDPIRLLSSPNVGEFTAALAPRQIQLGARLLF